AHRGDRTGPGPDRVPRGPGLDPGPDTPLPRGGGGPAQGPQAAPGPRPRAPRTRSPPPQERPRRPGGGAAAAFRRPAAGALGRLSSPGRRTEPRRGPAWRSHRPRAGARARSNQSSDVQHSGARARPARPAGRSRGALPARTGTRFVIHAVVDDLAFFEAQAVLRPADASLEPVTAAAVRLDRLAGPKFAGQRRISTP